MSKHAYASIRIPIEPENPAILRDEARCIKCGQCRRICEEEIGVGRMYDLAQTGDAAICVHCGQCALVCPANSITEVYEYQEVRKAIADPDKTVIFSTSPSVRVALGEEFGLPAGTFVEETMVAALRALGADYVLDTNFSADLTIMEEASELADRMVNHTKPLPQFTSCCPAWVKFVETFYPSFLPNLSSAKSPIGMQGPTIKTWFARENGLNPSQIVNVAVTPCTAKKFEIRRPEMNASATYLNQPGLRDMDYVVTTRELARWMREDGIAWDALAPSPYDSLMGAASGAGVIFGNTGGVMEAALRTAYRLITKQNPPPDLLSFSPVRGMEGIREASLTVGGSPVRVAIVHGTANAATLLERLQAGEASYDFIEVMTCRGGCIGGGGQPKTAVPPTDEIRARRIAGLYQKDEQCAVRLSHENPEVQRVYEKFYSAPLSERAEQLLHTAYRDRSDDLGDGAAAENAKRAFRAPVKDAEQRRPAASPSAKRRYRCTICGEMIELDGEMPTDYACPICGVGRENFEEIG